MPDSNNLPGLFALVDDSQHPLRRIPLTAEFKRELASMFSEQQARFLGNKELAEFTGSYNVDDGEIFAVSDYPLPKVISDAVVNPLTAPVLNLRNETHKIKALLSGVWGDEGRKVSFQVFDSGKLLKTGLTLIGSGETYKKLEEPGLVLQNKLTAHFDDGTLYFSSYHNTKRFLDLSDYYQEATDADLDTFAANGLFTLDDESTFKANADSIIRKKIALLQKNEVLTDIQVSDIQKVASNFNAELPEEHHISINLSEDGKIIIPADKKKLKELVRFLDEDYVTAPLTNRKCLTNSKKYLSSS